MVQGEKGLKDRTRGLLRRRRPLQRRQLPWKQRYNAEQWKMHLREPLQRSQRLPYSLERFLLAGAGMPRVSRRSGPIWVAVST